MRSLRTWLWVAAAVCGQFVASAATAPAEEPAAAIDISKLPPASSKKIDFAADIQPIFRKTCYSCHGAENQESGLRLDLRDRALAGGDGGKAIVPGKSAQSVLIHVVAGIDKDERLMPPEGEGTPLTKDQVALLRAWIDQGADWPAGADLAVRVKTDHWSLQPIAHPALPAVKDAGWVRNPIDRFVLARLEARGIAPAEQAEPATLVRRLYLDLLGLPPTPEAVDRFLADEWPDAYERLVDELLDSPHYGERWARRWLDLARYADSDGYEKDRPRPHAWRYRQWVISALNADLPYDEFTIEQIAGDLLPGATTEQKVATGFHRNTLHNTEGGTDPEEDRVKKTVDRANTTGSIWLGLTVGCAQCHSHKYDPITQKEYYSFYGFFNSINEVDVPAPLRPEEARKQAAAKAAFDRQHKTLEDAAAEYEKNQLPVAQKAWEEELKKSAAEPGDAPPPALPAAIAKILDIDPAKRNEKQQQDLAAHFRTLDPALVKLQKAVEEHAKIAPPVDGTLAQTVAELATPRPTRIHIRGDFLAPGDPVPVSTPAVLPPLSPRGAQPDRLDLARWLVDPANPLTARVTVNRLWQELFGRGLVPTVDDFGKQGTPPSHPLLLDYLAGELRDGGWGVKRLVRLVVTSATYRQSSAIRTELEEIDPENDLLARQTRRRVESEVIRDLALAVSGLWDPRVGGPSVRPPQPADYSAITYANSAKWTTSAGGDKYRRGLYTFFQRTSPYPMLITFDSPDSNETCPRRERSNTPLQALTLWNDPVFFEASQALGRRVVREAPAGDEAAAQRAARAFRLCLGRSPRPAELDAVVSLYEDQRALCGKDPQAAAAIVGTPAPAAGQDPAELAAWVLVGRTLLNVDEFITRE